MSINNRVSFSQEPSVDFQYNDSDIAKERGESTWTMSFKQIFSLIWQGLSENRLVYIEVSHFTCLEKDLRLTNVAS